MPLSDSQLAWVNHCLNCIPSRLPKPEAFKNVRLIAHRGRLHSQYIENTLKSFRHCHQAGIWAIEFDLQWTLDNEPVIHHDPSLQRVFQQKLSISQSSWQDLRRQQKDLPHLTEVVSELGKKIHFFIELKTPLTPQQRERLKSELKHLTPVDDYHLMSFDLRELSQFHDLPSRVRVAIVNTKIQNAMKIVTTENWGGLTGHYLILRRSHIKTLKAHQVNMGTGFPDGRNLFYREVKKGVPWIFTNEAQYLQQLQKHHSPPTF